MASVLQLCLSRGLLQLFTGIVAWYWMETRITRSTTEKERKPWLVVVI